MVTSSRCIRRSDSRAPRRARHGVPATFPGGTRPAATAASTAGTITTVPAHYLASGAICQPEQRALPGSDHLPLFSGFGAGDVAAPAGGVLDDELVPGELLDDEELDGGVPGVLEELADADGVLGEAALLVD